MAFVTCRITHSEFSSELLLTFGLFLEVGMLFLSFTIPMILRYGVEKGRLLLTIFAVAPSLMMVPAASWLEKSNIPLPSQEVLTGILLASPLFILAIFLFSFRISVSILKRKEF